MKNFLKWFEKKPPKPVEPEKFSMTVPILGQTKDELKIEPKNDRERKLQKQRKRWERKEFQRRKNREARRKNSSPSDQRPKDSM